jgi:hypothetical protein
MLGSGGATRRLLLINLIGFTALWVLQGGLVLPSGDFVRGLGQGVSMALFAAAQGY